MKSYWQYLQRAHIPLSRIVKSMVYKHKIFFQKKVKSYQYFVPLTWVLIIPTTSNIHLHITTHLLHKRKVLLQFLSQLTTTSTVSTCATKTHCRLLCHKYTFLRIQIPSRKCKLICHICITRGRLGTYLLPVFVCVDELVHCIIHLIDLIVSRRNLRRGPAAGGRNKIDEREKQKSREGLFWI